MGLLNRHDAVIFRKYFNEMVKLIGQSVAYQYIVDKKMTIHSEDNSKLSTPIRIDVLFDENPTVDTLNTLGWTSELNTQQPIVVNMPYNTPKLTVNARITVGSVDGVQRPRVFRITNIVSDLEFPDAYTCALVPVYDQYVQKNQYTVVNEEKINLDDSSRTSKDDNSLYMTKRHSIDTTPDSFINWENTYNFINDKQSPYSGK